MSEEQNIPEKNSKFEDANETISQEQPIKQPETTNQTLEISTSEIKSMEVHHHPDLHHRRKHFKEYFLEFLMIFLAVTLGLFC